MPLPFEVDQKKIAEYCRKHSIARLAFFGSVLTSDFGPDSDVDVLVEFEPGHVPGLTLSWLMNKSPDVGAISCLNSQPITKRLWDG